MMDGYHCLQTHCPHADKFITVMGQGILSVASLRRLDPGPFQANPGCIMIHFPQQLQIL